VARLVVNPHVLRRVLRPSLTEAPSLHRHYPASSYYGPLRHPTRTRPVSRELPVDPYRDLRWGFPCCLWSPMPTCHRHYPGRFNGACSLVYLHGQRPSPLTVRSAPATIFSGPAQRSLTLWPARSRSRHATHYTESSDSFVASAAASIATGWSEPVPGRELHPLKSSAFSRRTVTSIEQDFVGFFGGFSRSSRKSGSCAAKAACFKRGDPWRGGRKR
jgi:hypothetical protein